MKEITGIIIRSIVTIAVIVTLSNLDNESRNNRVHGTRIVRHRHHFSDDRFVHTTGSGKKHTKRITPKRRAINPYKL
jgi:hypothetical protein